jgi:hypothetical protein
MYQSFSCRYGSIIEGIFFLEVLIFLYQSHISTFMLRHHNFFPKCLVKEKLYLQKADTFLHLQEKFQKITMEFT